MTRPPRWARRATEEANLFNPAFVATLIDRIAAGHHEGTGEGLPWPLIYVALPAVLHAATRDALPKAKSTSMPAWTSRHPLLVEGVTTRAPALRPLVTEALLFGLAHDVITRDGDRLLPGRRARRSPRLAWREPTADYRSCTEKATFFGRWCAVSGTPATIYALWGLRP